MIIATPQTAAGKEAGNSHGGTGRYFVRTLLENVPGAGAVKYVRDLVLHSNASIGLHPHHGDEEVYFVIAGNGVMTVDREEQPIGPGSVCLTLSGSTHGLRNIGEDDLRIAVFCAKVAQG
jgi:mannose-6-phosphate isomerase-like protein (cupin superfamily)